MRAVHGVGLAPGVLLVFRRRFCGLSPPQHNSGQNLFGWPFQNWGRLLFFEGDHRPTVSLRDVFPPKILRRTSEKSLRGRGKCTFPTLAIRCVRPGFAARL